jgi:hypothetical protein
MGKSNKRRKKRKAKTRDAAGAAFVKARLDETAGNLGSFSVPIPDKFLDPAVGRLQEAMKSLSADFREEKIHTELVKTPDGHKLNLTADEKVINNLHAVAKMHGVSTDDYLNRVIKQTLDNPHYQAGRDAQRKSVTDKTRFRLPGLQDKLSFVTFGRKLVVEMYHRTLKGMRDPVEMTQDSGTISLPEAWSYLNQASIFEVPTSLYTELYHEADKEVCRVAGQEWLHPADRSQSSEEEALRNFKVTEDEGKRQSYPEHMPFEYCYFGFDIPWLLNPGQAALFGAIASNEPVDVFMYAILAAKGRVFSLHTLDHGYKCGIAIRCEREDNKWIRPLTLMPWIFNWMVEWINSHRLTVEETTHKFGYRHHYKRAAKRSKNKPIPPPYYTVLIKDVVRKERPRTDETGMKMRRAQRHRSAVRGHGVMRVRRGKLPLDPKLEQELRKDKRRRIFTDRPLDAETYADLAKRGIRPKAHDEWMAVLKYWRNEFMRGPEDGPFIPAVRKSGRKRRRRV